MSFTSLQCQVTPLKQTGGLKQLGVRVIGKGVMLRATTKSASRCPIRLITLLQLDHDNASDDTSGSDVSGESLYVVMCRIFYILKKLKELVC